MKKILLTVLTVAIMVLANTGASQANSIAIAAGDQIKLISYNGVDNAGVMTYNVYKLDGTTLIGSLETFCIQENVYVDFAMNSIASLTGSVGINGNNSWTTSGYVKQEANNIAGTGQLNRAVDYLFYRYASGAYKSTMNTKEKEADFQKVLWYLQKSNTTSFTPSATNPWETDLKTYLETPSMQNKSYGTEVINIVRITRDGNINLQNQLYNPVPEPATMLLFGTGIAGLAGIARRRRTND